MKEQEQDDGASLLRADPSAEVTTEPLPNIREIHVPAHTIRVKEATPKAPIYACECSVASHCEKFGGCLAEYACDEIAITRQLPPDYDDREAIAPGDYRYYATKSEVGSGNQAPSAERAPSTSRSAAQK